MEGMPEVRTLQSVAGAGMIQKKIVQKVVTEALRAFNGIKISLEKGVQCGGTQTTGASQ